MRGLTGVSVVILIIGDQQSIVLAGNGLLREVLVFDLGKFDHVGVVVVTGVWFLKE